MIIIAIPFHDFGYTTFRHLAQPWFCLAIHSEPYVGPYRIVVLSEHYVSISSKAVNNAKISI